MNIKLTLLNCAKNKYPPSFRLSNNMIISKKRSYTIPLDPMDLCNLITQIVTNTEISNTPYLTSKSSDIYDNYSLLNTLFPYCNREMIRLNKDIIYRDKLYSYITLALYLGEINHNNITIKDGSIIDIKLS